MAVPDAWLETPFQKEVYPVLSNVKKSLVFVERGGFFQRTGTQGLPKDAVFGKINTPRRDLFLELIVVVSKGKVSIYGFKHNSPSKAWIELTVNPYQAMSEAVTLFVNFTNSLLPMRRAEDAYKEKEKNGETIDWSKI